MGDSRADNHIPSSKYRHTLPFIQGTRVRLPTDNTWWCSKWIDKEKNCQPVRQQSACGVGASVTSQTTVHLPDYRTLTNHLSRKFWEAHTWTIKAYHSDSFSKVWSSSCGLICYRNKQKLSHLMLQGRPKSRISLTHSSLLDLPPKVWCKQNQPGIW